MRKGAPMTHKEELAELLERLPEEIVREVQHYAEYLVSKSQHEDWSRLSLDHLGVRYTHEEVEYTTDDLKR
jgi:hypothetical protein